MSLPTRIVPGLALALGALALLPPQAEAQGVQVEGVGRGGEDSSTIVYEQAYFARYNVITATDMLRRIPGTSQILDTQRQDVRGFGSGGDQILIDGERIAGKANQIGAVLERIQASQVLRIELIRGTSSELDVRSEGLIINIVLAGDLKQAAGSWRLEGELVEGGPFRPAASISYGGDKGRLNYFASVQTRNGYREQDIDDRFFAPGDGRLFERREEKQAFVVRNYTLTTNLLYRFVRGDKLRLNGLIERRRFTDTEISDQFSVDQTGMESFIQTEPRRLVNKGLKWELGADYEREMGKTGRLKIVFVRTDDNGDVREVQRRILGGVDLITNIQATDSVRRETILRSSYKWDLSKKQNLEIGVEGALNNLDTALRIFEDQDGELVELDFFNLDSMVDEVRVEGFATHVWKPAGRLTIESALNAEYSVLDQVGSDVQTSRNFFFVKPRLDIRFDLTPSKQFRFKVERTVGQLNFANFVTTFDEEDDLPDSGNPDLVPEKAWEFELAYEQRLAADGGVIKARLFYNDISDKLGRVIGIIGNDRAAMGNVGDASLLGAEASASIRLAMLKVPDAVLTASYLRQRSRFTDFFTGERHKFFRTPKYIWKVGFRHDTQTRRSLSYGFDFSRKGGRTTDDIDEHRDFHSHGELSAFIEIKILGGLTLRFEGERLLGDDGVRDRIRFVGNKALGEVLQTELRSRILSRSYTLVLRGNF